MYWHVFGLNAGAETKSMKRTFTLISLVLVLTSFTFPPASKGIEDIVAALKAGNAVQVSRYFDTTVEITLPQKSSTYSRSQAEIILRDFFTTNNIRSFNVIHKGENAGSQYCIGTLIARSAQYRTTVFMKQKGDRQTLQEIRFENR
jgi:hypothetical protein